MINIKIPWYVGIPMLIWALWPFWVPLLVVFGVGYWLGTR